MARQWGAASVRTHQRKMRNGQTVTVNAHSRKKRGPNPRHIGKLGGRAVRHVRAGRKGKAAMLAGLCLGEAVLYLTFSTTAVLCAVVGSFLIGASWILTR